MAPLPGRGARNEFVHDPNPFPYDNTPDFYDQPPQHNVETYSCELCGNDSHYGYDCPPRFPFPSRHFNSIYYDDYDDEESTIPLNEIISRLPLSIAITPVLPTMEPVDSLIMGNEELSTIPEKESDELIKSSIEDLVPIPSESEDTSESDCECDLASCDDFSSIDVPRDNSVTFFNPLFDSNNDFTSSDDESLPEEDVQEEIFKIYSNPLFEFNDEYISSNVNPLFNKVLEHIENKESYVSNLDEQDLLVTHLSELNEDKCFDPGGDEIEACLTSDSIPPGIDGAEFDPKGDILLLEKLLNDYPSSPLPLNKLNFEELKDTIPNLPPAVFLDCDPRSLADEHDKDYLESMVKVFDPGVTPCQGGNARRNENGYHHNTMVSTIEKSK
ncbi:hypothetical protein Tco_1061232 [Tanacetum coccineum]